MKFNLTFIILSFVFSVLVFAHNKPSSVFIPLPNKCVKIVSIDRNKVHLEDSVSCYEFQIVQVNINPEFLDKGIEIYYKGKLWKVFHANGKSLDSMVDAVTVLAYESFYKDLENQGVLKDIKEEDRKKIEESLQQVTKSLHNVYRESDKYRSELEKYVYSGKMDNTSPKNQLLADSERIYVFVSSSLPSEVVRAYVKDASLLGSRQVIFVLRGGIGGLKFMRPTVEWIYNVVKKDDCFGEKCSVYPVRFQIDPFLFRRFKIEKVPAVVYVENVKPLFGYSEGLPEVEIGRAFVSYGDVSLFYHLFVLGKASGNDKLKSFAEKFLINPVN